MNLLKSRMTDDADSYATKRITVDLGVFTADLRHNRCRSRRKCVIMSIIFGGSMSKKIIDTIRLLSAEQVEAANSGHPGLPLGAAAIAYALYAKSMKYSPNNPKWLNRDRFVLSAGHGSALLYSVLHLFSSGVGIDDLKAFRQKGSKTPGHPESDLTPGVDISTGPLGQGIANAVGLALAEAKLAQKFNRDDFPLIDHYTYVLHGDGCLMEGVSYEAASLAGHLGLKKLIMLYDSNRITIEGDTDITFTENIQARFESMGWDYFYVEDGNDVEAIANAVETAKTTDKPSLIEVRTVIGFGAKSVEGKAKAHGAPLGETGMKELYASVGAEGRTPFEVEDEIYAELQTLRTTLNAEEAHWHERLKEYKSKYPELGTEFELWTKGNADCSIEMEYQPAATRVSGGIALNRVFAQYPNLTGGSADLAPTNGTELKESEYISKGNYLGANLHFGVREHAMGAITNGMAAHGGLKTFAATFLSFSNYMSPAIRMAALMGLPNVFVFTHDSIGVGEDGPTHQPVDQLPALRAIPRLNVFRPADAKEVAAVYETAFSQKEQPSAIILSRQNLPLLDGTSKEAAKKGAYIIYEDEKPAVNLVATGSEVETVLKAAELLKEKEIQVRVISMPCAEVFERQPDEYKNKVFSKSTPCISVEASSTLGWKKYADLAIGVDDFGISAPGKEVYAHFGLTPEAVAERIADFLE